MQNPRWNESITPFTSAAKERGASKERYYIAKKINDIINNSKDDRQAINLILNFLKNA